MKVIIIFVLIISYSKVWSQQSYVDSVLNEFMYYDDEAIFYMELNNNKKFHFMYVNSTYNNKSLYAGREVGNPQYYLSGQVSYFNSNGLFLGLATSSGTWFSTNDNANYNNSFTVGYGKSLKNHSWFRYNASYSRYFGFNNGFDFSSTYSNNLHFGIGTRHKLLGTRAGLNYLFGDESKSTFSLDIFSPLTLVKTKAFFEIGFEPEVSFFFDSEMVENIDSNQNLEYTSKFGWMNTELILPMQINMKNLDIELGYTINFPRSLDPAYTYANTHLFTLSLGYIFDISR